MIGRWEGGRVGRIRGHGSRSLLTVLNFRAGMAARVAGRHICAPTPESPRQIWRQIWRRVCAAGTPRLFCRPSQAEDQAVAGRRAEERVADILREIDEDMRRESAERLWQKYGV